MHGRNGLTFGMLMYHDHLQTWLDFGHGLLVFLIFVMAAPWLHDCLTGFWRLRGAAIIRPLDLLVIPHANEVEGGILDSLCHCSWDQILWRRPSVFLILWFNHITAQAVMHGHWLLTRWLLGHQHQQSVPCLKPRNWCVGTWLMTAVYSNLNFLYFLVRWWRHQMETFSALLALCVENSPVTGEFPSQRPVTWSFDVFLWSGGGGGGYAALVWNWSNAVDIWSALWILMAWCFNTRASVTTVLSRHPSISSCWWVNDYCPACRTTLIATRFRVAVICPIIQVPHCIRVFFYFVWFVFINHIFQFYYELCTYCNILDIYLS